MATRNLNIRTKNAMKAFLEDDLRIDFSVLQNVDTEIFRLCKEKGRKKVEIELLTGLF